VLPGEKVQFMIAALSTRYDPKVVVAAAGSAFAGWTAIEIAFGQALQSALPGVVLDAVTAVLFFVFAYLLYRSMPNRESGQIASDGDGDPEAVDSDPEPSDATLAALESVTLPRTARPLRRIVRRLPADIRAHRHRRVRRQDPAGDDRTGRPVRRDLRHLAGRDAGDHPISLANAYFFHTFAHRFDMRRAHLGSAVLFAFFGADTVLSIAAGFSVWETFMETVSAAASGLF